MCLVWPSLVKMNSILKKKKQSKSLSSISINSNSAALMSINFTVYYVNYH